MDWQRSTHYWSEPLDLDTAFTFIQVKLHLEYTVFELVNQNDHDGFIILRRISPGPLRIHTAKFIWVRLKEEFL